MPSERGPTAALNYISTRGGVPPIAFDDVTLSGLAPDGGLYVPATWPSVSGDALRGLAGCSYAELALEIIARFSGATPERTALAGLVERAYARFDHPAIAPLTQLDERLWFMELFHGPTFAFKDFALQFLGALFEHLLDARQSRCTIVGATSGDTGSAAIEACRGLARVELFMLHPAGRVSEVQRRQMTTVDAANIHNIALEGTFDDCQAVVKALFGDAAFRRRHALSAVNSINWARIVAQVVYYFRAALALGAPERGVAFAVPTGNFGNVFAGYAAARMGLPVTRLIVGSNQNDILTRFFRSGTMAVEEVVPTLSPSMDIQVSSNFERLLFELVEQDHATLAATMARFRADGQFSVAPDVWHRARELFEAHRFDDEETCAEIRATFEKTGQILDPHSAIGVAAARRHCATSATPVIALGTAHPAKFNDAIERAIGRPAPLPPRLEHILELEERYHALANDVETVKRFIDSRTADRASAANA